MLRSIVGVLAVCAYACGGGIPSPQEVPDAGTGVGDAGGQHGGDAGPNAFDAGHEDAGATCAMVGSGEACAVAGERRCAPGGVQSCEALSGCLVWSVAQSCGADAICVEGGTCQGCAGQTGTFSNQTLESGGETRHYFLHVPASYACTTPMPVLVDFHGTAGEPAPEEAYGLDAAVKLANEAGFILVRPRSRSSLEGGYRIFRWDQNPGDLGRNATFTRKLLEDLGGRYHLDAARRYVMGFSSGTNMSAQFLGDDPALFSGYGLVGGGYWSQVSLPIFGADAPRVYAVTGYRDYMVSNQRPLLAALAARGHPASKRFVREADTGHELYDWHYDELWAWLDRAERPDAGAASSAWQVEQTGATQSLIELAPTPQGEWVAVGAEGTLLRRSAQGLWTSHATSTSGVYAPHWTGVCVLDDGRGLAVGEMAVATTTDSGATWFMSGPVPAFNAWGFQNSYLTAVACSGTNVVVGGGYWAGVRSVDGAATWSDAPMWVGGAYPAQIADVAFAPNGTAVSIGYPLYVARSAAGGGFVPSSIPFIGSWLNAVTAAPDGTFWIVGDEVVLRSSNDGVSFTARMPQDAQDLYAVAALDAQTAVVAGARGAVHLTRDGGLTWMDLSIGRDVFIGDVVFTGVNELLVVGEGGLALTRTF